jgi:hypothetical protein
VKFISRPLGGHDRYITLTDNQEHEAAGSIRGDDNSGIALKLGIVLDGLHGFSGKTPQT